MNFMICSVPIFELIFDVFVHHFWFHFVTLLASICMLLRTLFLTFSFLFLTSCPLGSLCSFWLHFGRLLAPIWLPFGVPLLPFGSLLVAFGTPALPLGAPALHLAPPALHVAPISIYLGYLWLRFLPYGNTLGVEGLTFPITIPMRSRVETRFVDLRAVLTLCSRFGKSVWGWSFPITISVWNGGETCFGDLAVQTLFSMFDKGGWGWSFPITISI